MRPINVRLDPEKRRAVIVAAAIKVGSEGGFWEITADSVADACEVSTSPHTVRHYFPLTDDLRILAAAECKDVRETCIRFGLIDEVSK